MVDTTTNLALRMPGGGSQGAHGADETADVDVFNDNMKIIDAAALPLVLGGRLFTESKTITTDWNSVTETGFYKGQNLANAPASGWFFVTAQRYDNNYIAQTAIGFTDFVNRTWQRTRSSTGWSIWSEVYKVGGDINQNSGNWNNWTSPGTFRFNGAGGLPSGFPVGAYNFGLFEVKYGSVDYGGLTQFYYPDGAGTSRPYYMRSTFGASFGNNWGIFNPSGQVGAS